MMPLIYYSGNMRKKYAALLTLLIIFTLAATPGIYAQDSEDEDTETTTTSSTTKMNLQEDRQARIEEAKQMREEFQETVQTKREEAQQEFAAARETFQKQLTALKDEQKAAIVEQVDARLQKLNETKTDALSQHLNSISEVLDRIDEKAADLDDPTEVDKAIEEARAAIQTAQSAVEEQAGLEYVVEITDETSLRADVQKVVDAFKSDMKTVIDLVRDAHKQAREAAQALGATKSSMMKTDDSSSTTDTMMDESSSDQ